MNSSSNSLHFPAFTTKSGSPFRKEYLHSRLFRLFLKLLRTVLKGNSVFPFFPSPSLFPLTLQFERITLHNSLLFTHFLHSTPKSNLKITAAYVKSILEIPEMKQCYAIYVDLMLGKEGNIEEISGKLGLFCCGEKEKHGEKCREKWRFVREYVEKGILRELKVE